MQHQMQQKTSNSFHGGLASLSATFLFFAATVADAFPELTRHGYVSCTACHVSPNGGGAMTPYGRGLSRELLSTWGGTREAEVGHGLLPKQWADALRTRSFA